jgi:hypothetical protein
MIVNIKFNRGWMLNAVSSTVSQRMIYLGGERLEKLRVTNDEVRMNTGLPQRPALIGS